MSDILCWVIGIVLTCIMILICVFLICALEIKDEIWEEIIKKLK